MNSFIRSHPPNQGKSSEVLYGADKAIGRSVYFMSNVKESMDVFFDKDTPSIVVEVEEFRNGYLEIKKRGGKIRAFTEITKDNSSDCRKLMNLVDELRHIDGVKGGIAVSESEYMASILFKGNDPLTHVIYSNVKEVVEQGQYIFDTMWNKGIPASQKLKEIKEGKVETVSTTTRIIENKDEIVKELGRMTAESSVLSTCLSAGGLLYSYNNFFEIKKGLVDKEKKGLHKGVRYVTTIDTKENAELARIMLDEGIRIRHVNNLPPMSFGVSHKEIAATFESMGEGNKFQNLIISTEPAYLKHFAAIFEELWRNSIDANQRLSEIEEGIIMAPDIEIIRNPTEAVNRILNLLSSAQSEVMGIFPTFNSFRRQLRMGIANIINHLIIDRKVHFRILVPGDEGRFNEILSNDPEANKLLQLLDGDKHNQDEYIIKERKNSEDSNDLRTISPKSLEMKCIDLGSDSTLGILVVDRAKSFIIETKEDSKDSSYEAAGLGAYSNSTHMASSYISIFEFLWKQIELADKIRLHDKMQNEFVNTAAHELRTPIQPILSISQILFDKQGNIQDHVGLLEIITRNAYRLKQLTDDILDVSRIEGKSLKLIYEPFDLVSLAKRVINDISIIYKRQHYENDTSRISVLCSYHEATVYGDMTRVEQVIRNLLTNALNFTTLGCITVSLFRDSSSNEWVVSVKDTGPGISADIFPRLFTKFVTKSQHGIGLGLYISKNIIEAHGGRIWAENNKEESGATFNFALPIAAN
jgi:two-component system sensor histidine kinase VicK